MTKLEPRRGRAPLAASGADRSDLLSSHECGTDRGARTSVNELETVGGLESFSPRSAAASPKTLVCMSPMDLEPWGTCIGPGQEWPSVARCGHGCVTRS